MMNDYGTYSIIVPPGAIPGALSPDLCRFIEAAGGGKNNA
jgi:hypothetical protein